MSDCAESLSDKFNPVLIYTMCILLSAAQWLVKKHFMTVDSHRKHDSRQAGPSVVSHSEGVETPCTPLQSIFKQRLTVLTAPSNLLKSSAVVFNHQPGTPTTHPRVIFRNIPTLFLFQSCRLCFLWLPAACRYCFECTTGADEIRWGGGEGGGGVYGDERK